MESQKVGNAPITGTDLRFFVAGSQVGKYHTINSRTAVDDILAAVKDECVAPGAPVQSIVARTTI